MYNWKFWKLFESTQHGEDHISGHQDQPSTMPRIWVTPWSGHGPCHWRCWCTFGSSEMCSSQHSVVKNIYLDTKIYLLRCQEAELRLEVAMDHDIGFVGVGLHLAVLKHVPVNSAWSKTYIWTPRSTFNYARKLNYTLKWPRTLLMALFLMLVFIWQLWYLFWSTQHGQKHISGHQDQPSIMPGSWVTSGSGPGPCCWCWCTSGSSETCSSQFIKVKKIYLNTKINLFYQIFTILVSQTARSKTSSWTKSRALSGCFLFKQRFSYIGEYVVKKLELYG